MASNMETVMNGEGARRPREGWDDEYLRFREVPIYKLMVEKWNDRLLTARILDAVAPDDRIAGGVGVDLRLHRLHLAVAFGHEQHAILPPIV
jgi:hypothetical protein